MASIELWIQWCNAHGPIEERGSSFFTEIDIHFLSNILQSKFAATTSVTPTSAIGLILRRWDLETPSGELQRCIVCQNLRVKDQFHVRKMNAGRDENSYQNAVRFKHSSPLVWRFNCPNFEKKSDTRRIPMASLFWPWNGVIAFFNTDYSSNWSMGSHILVCCAFKRNWQWSKRTSLLFVCLIAFVYLGASWKEIDQLRNYSWKCTFSFNKLKLFQSKARLFCKQGRIFLSSFWNFDWFTCVKEFLCSHDLCTRYCAKWIPCLWCLWPHNKLLKLKPKT